jgi:hypothetical protein
MAGVQSSGAAFSCKLNAVGFALPLELVLLKIVGYILAAKVQEAVNVELALDKEHCGNTERS